VFILFSVENLVALGTARCAAGDGTVTVTGKGLEIVLDIGKNVANAIWHVSREIVVVNLKDFQHGQVLELIGDITRELVVVQPDSAKLGGITQFLGDRSCKLGVGHGERSEVLEKSNLCGDSSGQVISIKPQGDCKFKKGKTLVQLVLPQKRNCKQQVNNLQRLVISPVSRKDKSPSMLFWRM
jgi:hypothetical protein